MEIGNEDLTEPLIVRLNYKCTLNQNEMEELNASSKILIDQIREYLEKDTFIWDPTQMNQYEFRMPLTAFDETKAITFSNHEDSEVLYRDESSCKLTDDHINDISLRGEFDVTSTKAKAYTWKLSTMLVIGSENRLLNYYSNMSASFKMLYYFKYRFNCKFNYGNLFFSLKNAFYFVRDSFRLFLGTPYYSPISVDEIANRKYYERITSEMIFDTSIYHEQLRSRIFGMFSQIQNEWLNQMIIEEDLLRKKNMTESDIEAELLKIRLKFILSYFQDKFGSKLKPSQLSIITNFIEAKHIILDVEYQHHERLNKAQNDLMKRINEEHKIKSHILPWLNKTYYTAEKEIREEFLRERNEEMTKRLVDHPLALYLVNSFEEFTAQKPHIIKDLKSLPDNWGYTSKSSFHFTYCSPKSEATHYTDSYTNKSKVRYSLSLYNTKNVETDHYFWRISLTFMRLIFIFWELLFLIRDFCFNSSFGIKALCTKTIYKKPFIANEETGEIGYSMSFTYYSSIENLYNWCIESRELFLRNRHTSFFGSASGNVINIIEVYFFKMLILGTLLIFFYPLAIFAYTLFFFAFFICCYPLSVVGVILAYLFEVLIYDTSEPSYSRSCPLFPFMVILIWRLIICSILNFLLFLLFCVLQVLVAILAFIWAQLRFLVRTIYDFLMLQIVKCFAKIPKSDTSMAWKIRGPGMNRSQFLKLSVDESLILVRSYMEKLQLDFYEQEIRAKISKPQSQYEQFSKVMKVFGGYSNTPYDIYQNVNSFLTVLERQITNRRITYPQINSNIRFTDSELTHFVIASQDLIKDFINNNELNSLWKKYKLVPGNFDLITEGILKEAFGENILEDIEDSEERVEVASKHNVDIANLVQHAKKAADIDKFSVAAMMNVSRLKASSNCELEDESGNVTRYLKHGKLWKKHLCSNNLVKDSRNVNLSFLGTNEHLYINIYYLQKERYESERLEDLKLSNIYY